MTTEGADWDAEACGVTACTRCPQLVDHRSRIVNGTGPTDADLLFVGEAPGADEDAAGAPFVGRSGEILDAALTDAALDRDTVRITNCVRCRPPENRDPTADERANCRAHLDREIAAVDPELVIALGKVPAEHLLGRTVAVTTAAGRTEQVAFGNREWPLLVSVHPAAVLYDRSQRETLDRVLSAAAERC